MSNHQSKKSKKTPSINILDDESSRSEAPNGDKNQEIQSIQPRFESPRVDRSSSMSFIKDVTQKLPRNTVTQCKMYREKRGLALSYVYQLFGEEDQPIFVAKTESTMFSTKFSVIETVTGNKIGKIESNITSLVYKVTGPNETIKIEYNENFMGRHGPRAFTMTIEDPERPKIFVLKPPIVLNGEYYQNFHDLKTAPSIKNFICVPQNEFCEEVCIFVRNPDNSFTLRVKEPFSLFEAFALALTSLHTGIFHR
ncbi:hypothetical protein TVAG_433020 [Trichomonas vaginalis G3]|uniref:Tubby C-terminal domain-containing protein n=1 Tax=Trichomonas vaginalis (strain ATCC PRA-98 / G3) TaxID=412133 RepID=A2DIU3_TRIV3|nr:tubby c-terminal domain-like family [Trichomonas vaginalis G3]EAY19706.1 hypothetical protein TVAG_433020 [Trichomonas vaginalis G3]KAI5521274.1 tubby c-terminal domain-like family [Trichomonas vaginalis G3]|eukprot:XP_001580692.1 hypothetical protein [Trichomonas vaginalis G3]